MLLALLPWLGLVSTVPSRQNWDQGRSLMGWARRTCWFAAGHYYVQSALDMSPMFKATCAAVLPRAAALTFDSGNPPDLHHEDMRARNQRDDSASGMCE